MLIGYKKNSFKFCNSVAIHHIMLIHLVPRHVAFFSEATSVRKVTSTYGNEITLFVLTPLCSIRLFCRTLQFHDSGMDGLSPESAVCCQVELSATGRSLTQRSPTECDVSECHRQASTMRRS